MKNLLFSFFVLIPSLLQAQTLGSFAGGAGAGYSGDGGYAQLALLNSPATLTFDAAGNAYIADQQNHCIRKVNTLGIISTIAGTGGSHGYSGDGGSALSALLYLPYGVAVDQTGNVYISDAGNYCIRKINGAGIISTIAGISGAVGNTGDGGPATAAQIGAARGMSVDHYGNLYIADGSVIREIDTAGIIRTVAGDPALGSTFSGDGGPATAAGLFQAMGVAFDASGNLYIADALNHCIRKVNSSGIISTVAGMGGMAPGHTGDGGLAVNATLYEPFGVAVDAHGNMYIADTYNFVVRKVNTSGIITTFAGNGFDGNMGGGGPATAAEFSLVGDVAVDISGNVYIDDGANNAIRDVILCTPGYAIVSGTNYVCPGATVTLTTNYTGGVWYATNGNATVSGGVVTGVLSGTDTIVYAVANNCGTPDTVKHIVLVRPVSACPTGVSTVAKQGNGYAVFPNPASTEITVSSAIDKISSIVICNLLGQTVFSHTYDMQQVQVGIAGLPKGIYLIKINGFEVSKFVKE